MAIKLMYLTNNEEVARIAENNGVDRIFIDLEVHGKADRQRGLNTVISYHSINDVQKIKGVLNNSELLVRVNPLYEDSKHEIDSVIENGADIVMLPYFKAKDEVEIFIKQVRGRAKVCLLLETVHAVNNIDSILSVPGIDCVHIGLNDLYLGNKMNFIFEPLANGMVENICRKVKQKKIPYGFGGIARIGELALPAENILAEHYRLGSSMVILSRSFCNTTLIKDLDKIREIFTIGVKEIRDYEAVLLKADKSLFELNKEYVREKVEEIALNCKGQSCKSIERVKK